MDPDSLIDLKLSSHLGIILGSSGSSASLGSLARVGVAPRGRLGSPVTAQGLILGALGGLQGSILGVLGSLRVDFYELWDAPKALGRPWGGTPCPKRSLDESWSRFWLPNGSQKGAKILPKSIPKLLKNQ